MRQALGIGFTIVIGLALAWAGLHYDRALLVGAVILGAAISMLWIWSFTRPVRVVGRDAPKPIAVELARQVLAEASKVKVLGPTADRLERVMPRMHAAILSLHKEYGLARPKDHGEDGANFFAQLRYLQQVVPLVEAGHLDQAREAAQAD